jgi:hypothetical protein
MKMPPAFHPACLLCVPVLCFTLASCDKAKSLADKASTQVKQRIDTALASDSEAVDENLAKLVDQTAEGAIFRKDLPFPARLEVLTTRRQQIEGRLHHSSEIENRTEMVNGTRNAVFKLERSGNQVRHVPQRQVFAMPTVDSEKSADNERQAPDPLELLRPAPQARSFRLQAGVWKPEAADSFRAATLTAQLSPMFVDLLIDNALEPRPLWFAKRRFKPGDSLTVAGDSLPMLVAGKATGSLTLTLESVEPVEGHPCGVFAVKGAFSRKRFPDFEGTLVNESVTIESGKLWLSLLHPVILREELVTVQSLDTGARGGAVTRGRLKIEVSTVRAWKALES